MPAEAFSREARFLKKGVMARIATPARKERWQTAVGPNAVCPAGTVRLPVELALEPRPLFMSSLPSLIAIGGIHHNRTMRGFILGVLLAVSLSPLGREARPAGGPVRAAVFDFEWIDTSLEGAMNGLRADEQERLRMLGERLRRELAESGRFEIVDIAPKAEQARQSNLQACGGCDARMARELGAKLVITGTVQKVSNLILNINLYTRDAETGRLLGVSSADMRGNTEESWFRTLDWIVKNRLLANELKR